MSFVSISCTCIKTANNKLCFLMQLIAFVVMMKIDLYISLEKVYPQLSRLGIYINTLILWNARNVKEYTRSCERRA